MQMQLVYNFKQGDKDISDILRGKIQVLDEFLGMKDMFNRVEDMEEKVKNEEIKQKGAK